MKSGIELIAAERKEQIELHGRTIEKDKIFNASMQLTLGQKLLYATMVKAIGISFLRVGMTLFVII